MIAPPWGYEVDEFCTACHCLAGETHLENCRTAALEAVIEAMAGALEHMRMCGSCAEDEWHLCEGGRDAESALASYRSLTEGGERG